MRPARATYNDGSSARSQCEYVLALSPLSSSYLTLVTPGTARLWDKGGLESPAIDFLHHLNSKWQNESFFCIFYCLDDEGKDKFQRWKS